MTEQQSSILHDQAWFWSERWKNMEQEAQADIDAGRVARFSDVDQAIDALSKYDQEIDS